MIHRTDEKLDQELSEALQLGQEGRARSLIWDYKRRHLFWPAVPMPKLSSLAFLVAVAGLADPASAKARWGR